MNRKLRIIAALLIMALLCAAVAGCSQSAGLHAADTAAGGAATGGEYGEAESAAAEAETQGLYNSTCFSQAAEAGDGVLYAGRDMGLYYTDSSGNTVSVLDNMVCSDVHYVDGSIYFCNVQDDFSLWRANMDGSGQEQISADSAWWVYYLGKYIYYVSASASSNSYSGCIVRCDLDGTNRTVLVEDSVDFMFVDREFIYYNVDDSGAVPGIYRMKRGGGEAEMISEDNAFRLITVEDGLYYIDFWDNHLYAMDANGANKRLISEKNCYGLNYFAGKLYYGDGSENVLYAYDIEKQSERVAAESCGGDVSVVKGRLYFYDTQTNELVSIAAVE